MAKLVSKVYGDALFETAMEKERMDVIYEEVVSLVPVLEGNPELMALLNNPRIVKEEKASIIHQVFAGRVEEELMGLLAVVVEKDRQNDLLPIFSYFIQRVKEFKRIGTVSVTSAVELSEDQKNRLQEKLLTVTDYVMLETDYQVEPALIGGMVIRIGDRVVDSSIRTRLYEMKKELSQLQMA